jgi:hypothetical protein
MIRTKHGTRLRLIAHEPGSHYVRCRRLNDGKEFDWKITELTATGGPNEINQALARLDSEFSPARDGEKGIA